MLKNHYIGCGMVAMKTQFTASDLPDSLKQARHQIERDVPVGFNYHRETVITGKQGLEAVALKRRIEKLLPRFDQLKIMAHGSGSIPLVGANRSTVAVAQR